MGREGSESTIYKQIKIVVPAIADNGQPQGLSLLTVGNKHFENFMPLARQRCVEVCTVQYDSIQVVQDDSIQFFDILEGKEMT